MVSNTFSLEGMCFREVAGDLHKRLGALFFRKVPGDPHERRGALGGLQYRGPVVLGGGRPPQQQLIVAQVSELRGRCRSVRGFANGCPATRSSHGG